MGMRPVEFWPFNLRVRAGDRRFAPRPVGKTTTVSWTAPVKLKLVRVIVVLGTSVLFVEGGGRIVDIGLAEIAKSGRVVVIVSVDVRILENPLIVLLAVIVSWKLP